MLDAPLTTTLNRIRAHGPCEDGWRKLLAGLGKTAPDDEPLSYATILRIVGLDDALWCCRAEPQHDRTWRLFAIWCARQVEHLLTDERSKRAIDVAERHANGQATDQELVAARVAARDARDAGDATWAAWAATLELAWAAAACAASEAAWAAATAARAAASDAQAAKFLELVGAEDD